MVWLLAEEEPLELEELLRLDTWPDVDADELREEEELPETDAELLREEEELLEETVAELLREAEELPEEAVDVVLDEEELPAALLLVCPPMSAERANIAAIITAVTILVAMFFISDEF